MVWCSQRSVHLVVQQRAGHDRHIVAARIGTGWSNARGSKLANYVNIGDDGRIVAAIVYRANVHHKAGCETPRPSTTALGVFGDFFVQIVTSRRIFVVDRVKIAGTKAAPAAYAFVVIDESCAAQQRTPVRTVFMVRGTPRRWPWSTLLAGVVLLHFAAPAAVRADALNSQSRWPRAL